MVKQRIKTIAIAVALMLALTGVSGIIAESLGISVTQPVFACNDPGTSGGC